MTIKTKSRAGGYQATLHATSDTGHFNAMQRRIKATGMTLALWSLIPVGMANWMLERGGLRND